MEDKILNIGDAILSTKRIEYLLEQILINVIVNRYKDYSDEDRKDKINQAFQYVDDDMKSYAESLKPVK